MEAEEILGAVKQQIDQQERQLKCLEEMLTTAGDTGRPKIEAKFEIVYNYMKTSWEIDLNKLREIVLRRAEEAPNLDFDSLDDDDTDTPENSGTNE